MRKNLFFISLLLSSNVVFAGTEGGVKNALESYCVPIPNGSAYDSKPVCGSVFEGVYNSAKSTVKCDCETSKNTPYQTGDGRFLAYNKTNRRCEPQCSAGYGLVEPTKCPDGTYKDVIKRSNPTYNTIKTFNCEKCGAGKYSSGGTMICTTCPAGTYSGAGASGCTLCPAGTYSGDGASSCTPCPAGKYSGTGASGCSDCASQTSWSVWYNETYRNSNTSCGKLKRTATAYCQNGKATGPRDQSYTVTDTTTKSCSSGKYCSSGKCCYTDSSACSSCSSACSKAKSDAAAACSKAKDNCSRGCQNQSSDAQQACSQMCAAIQCETPTCNCSGCEKTICE